MMLRADGTSVTVEGAARAALDWMGMAPDRHYDVVVGTDSQGFPSCTKYVEVVAVRRTGAGGIFFYHVDRAPKAPDLRSKIYGETGRSLELAGKFMKAFQAALEARQGASGHPDVRFAIHCDVGLEGPTRDLLRGVTGWVESCGYECVVKPDSYAASGVANKYSK